MKSSRRGIWSWLLVGFTAVVLVSGLLVAFGDAGLPLPVGLVAGALLICLAAVLGAGVGGYRVSRSEGNSVFRSVDRGARTSLSTVFFLF